CATWRWRWATATAPAAPAAVLRLPRCARAPTIRRRWCVSTSHGRCAGSARPRRLPRRCPVIPRPVRPDLQRRRNPCTLSPATIRIRSTMPAEQTPDTEKGLVSVRAPKVMTRTFLSNLALFHELDSDELDRIAAG